jgi:N-acetylmuramoyl-L-alanine amidase
MNNLNNIIVHCSDSTSGDARIIDAWHKARGFKAPDGKHIGYHFVILNGNRDGKYHSEDDGLIEPGRSLDNDSWIEQNEIGAHALGFNDKSIGICLIGGAKGLKTAFTLQQYCSALLLCAYYKSMIPNLTILGHNETGSSKACPVISMKLFRERVSQFNIYALSCAEESIKKEGI